MSITATVQPTLREIQLAMAKTNSLFNAEVFGKRNFNALSDIYTADARILPPGAPMICGLKGIKQFWSNLIESANATAAVLTSEDVVLAGDDAIEIGLAKLSIAPNGESSEIEVKYVVHWKQEDGRWKWNIDIWNQNS